MIGLIILIVSAIYLALLVWATRAAYRWAMKRGISKSKSWAAAAGGFMAIYLPVFWDHIPTWIARKHSCSTQAGFWEYKTIEQWKKDNPGVAETLVAVEGVAPVTRSGDADNYTDTYSLNQRFSRVSRKSGPHPFNLWRWEYQVVDTTTGEILAKSVDFSSGNGLVGGADWPLRFWLQSGYCEDGGTYAAKQISVRERWKNIGRKE